MATILGRLFPYRYYGFGLSLVGIVVLLIGLAVHGGGGTPTSPESQYAKMLDKADLDNLNSFVRKTAENSNFRMTLSANLDRPNVDSYISDALEKKGVSTDPGMLRDLHNLMEKITKDSELRAKLLASMNKQDPTAYLVETLEKNGLKLDAKTMKEIVRRIEIICLEGPNPPMIITGQVAPPIYVPVVMPPR